MRWERWASGYVHTVDSEGGNGWRALLRVCTYLYLHTYIHTYTWSRILHIYPPISSNLRCSHRRGSPLPHHSPPLQPPRAAAIPSRVAPYPPPSNQRLLTPRPSDSLHAHASLPLRTIQYEAYIHNMTLVASPPLRSRKFHTYAEYREQTEGAPHSTEIDKARGRAGVGRNNRYGSGCRSSGRIETLQQGMCRR